MARTMRADADEVFRAVITQTEQYHGDARGDFVYTFTAGPFEDRRQASAAITRAKREMRRKLERMRWYLERCGREQAPGDLVEAAAIGHVQRAALVWEDVQ
jgi:hypothetical protein